MKENTHPTWYPEATVVCACGNTWKTGATVAEIRTDICSACHPFYTGEQRIVDTEGQVDRFQKRLELRRQKMAEAEQRQAARTPTDTAISELGLNKRAVASLADVGITTASQFIARVATTEGEEGLFDTPGIGRQLVAQVKRGLRERGYEIPAAGAAEAAE